LSFREDRATVRTAWGDRLDVFDDPLGRGVGRTGIHELPVSEVMWRLSGGDDPAFAPRRYHELAFSSPQITVED
jgi:hypothetical protein